MEGSEMKGWLLLNQKTIDDPSIQMIVGLIKKMELDIELVDIQKVQVLCSPEKIDGIQVGDRELPVPDFCLSAFFGGNNYHSQAVLTMLEGQEVFCVNSLESLKNTSDKLRTFQKIASSSKNILFPKTLLLTETLETDYVEKAIGFPCVVKVMHGSKGKGVIMVKSSEELKNILDIMGAGAYDDEILIQECIQASRGRDLRIMLAGRKYSQAYIRDNGDAFKSNLSQGGELQFLTPPLEVIKVAEEVAALLDIYFGSVDFLMGENNTYYICEANSMTGLTYSKESAGSRENNPLIEILKEIMKETARRKASLK
ncbi:ATP-grasp domain-containing protein [Eubacteriaceae bacterium ES3]|nr:ATP-grasp domain-containing protein [Eubacteriaceae bacterium ES3]